MVHFDPILTTFCVSNKINNLSYGQMQRTNLNFIQGVDFELFENLPSSRTKYLSIFDDSCEERSKIEQFVKDATARKHKETNTIYHKQNLFPCFIKAPGRLILSGTCSFPLGRMMNG